MAETKKATDTAKPPLRKLILGTVVFVIGFASPALIPWVLSTSWPDGLKAVLSGLLAFGIPELFMIFAAAVMGKEGFNYVMAGLGRFLKPLAPPDEVSKTRYTIGLFMFFVPLALGWLAPYFSHHIPLLEGNEKIYNIGGDIMIFLSLFVLGGDFWDKLRSLFVRQAKPVFPPKPAKK
ncbi:MAG: hypothetical protein KAH26_05490 [Bacteroidales bacterium]|nr:hypothetical protein [Bacteroidales bacterium]